MTPDQESPTGIDIYPIPASTVRVKRIIGMVALGVVVAVAFVIIYAVYNRQQRQANASSTSDVEHKAVPATTAVEDIIGHTPVLTPQPTADGTTPMLEPNPTAIPQSLAPRSVLPARPLAPAPLTPFPNLSSTVDEDDVETRAARKELEAIEAPTGIGGSARTFGQNFTTGGAPGSTPSIPFMSDQSRTTIDAPMRGGDHWANSAGMSPAAEYTAQNNQEQKGAFIESTRNRSHQNYLQSVRTAPLSRFEIKAGWQIPAIMEQEINSDQPGDLKGFVRENVYDTATGKYLLIPQGSRLFGHYNSEISYGQDAVQVIWDRLIFPDGSSLNLDGMIGQDARGAAGLRSSVDHHYGRLLGFAVLTSLFSAGVQLSQNRSGTILAVPSNGEIVGSAVGGQLSQLGAETFRRQMNVQPTIKIPAGYRFNVSVNRDIALDAPYSRR